SSSGPTWSRACPSTGPRSSKSRPRPPWCPRGSSPPSSLAGRSYWRERSPDVDATKVDPITTEIIRNSFISIAEDMNAALIRSAYSWIIYEALDCAVALIDADHTVLAHSSGLPLFLGNLEACVDYTEERFGRDAWQPGDAWVMNDSYIGGTHLNDVTVVAPIFVDDDLVGFAASRAHHMDIGAKDPGGTTDSTEIYQEGMRLEPIRLVEGGRLRDDVVQLMALNSRLPNQLV